MKPPGAAQAVLAHLLRKPEPAAPKALEWAHELARAPDAPLALKLRLCEQFPWRGEQEHIVSVLGEEPHLDELTQVPR